MSGQQLTEWMAYFELEPFGEERADYRMATLAALTANIHRDPEKSDEFRVQDFMPRFDGSPAEEAPQIGKDEAIAAIESMMMAYVIASGGQDLRKK